MVWLARAKASLPCMNPKGAIGAPPPHPRLLHTRLPHPSPKSATPIYQIR